MKPPEKVFQELLEDDIEFNLGLHVNDHFNKAVFDRLMKCFRDQDEGFSTLVAGRTDGYTMPEATWEDLRAAKDSFVKAMQLQGKSPEITVAILKKVFEPVFAARFDHYREIMSFLYRLTQDAEMLDRLIRA